jgi:glycosyltransferase involved in cell wall biosynthesis
VPSFGNITQNCQYACFHAERPIAILHFLHSSATAVMHDFSVSVVIPALNEEKRIGKCLESLCAQTAMAFEIIVVDDGSRDATADIVQSWIARHPTRISLIVNETTRELPATLNRGLSAARGEFLSWISADNFVGSDFVEKLTDVLRQRPEIDIVYGDTVTVDAGGAVLRRLDPQDFGMLPEKNAVRSCFFFRRRVLDAAGPYRGHWFTVEDYEFWLRCFGHGFRFQYVEGPTVFHRLHDDSLTRRFERRIKMRSLFVRSIFLRRSLRGSKFDARSHIAQLARDIVRENSSRRSFRYAYKWSERSKMTERPLIWLAMVWEVLRRRFH